MNISALTFRNRVIAIRVALLVMALGFVFSLVMPSFELVRAISDKFSAPDEGLVKFGFIISAVSMWALYVLMENRHARRNSLIAAIFFTAFVMLFLMATATPQSPFIVSLFSPLAIAFSMTIMAFTILIVLCGSLGVTGYYIDRINRNTDIQGLQLIKYGLIGIAIATTLLFVMIFAATTSGNPSDKNTIAKLASYAYLLASIIATVGAARGAFGTITILDATYDEDEEEDDEEEVIETVTENIATPILTVNDNDGDTSRPVETAEDTKIVGAASAYDIIETEEKPSAPFDLGEWLKGYFTTDRLLLIAVALGFITAIFHATFYTKSFHFAFMNGDSHFDWVFTGIRDLKTCVPVGFALLTVAFVLLSRYMKYACNRETMKRLAIICGIIFVLGTLAVYNTASHSGLFTSIVNTDGGNGWYIIGLAVTVLCALIWYLLRQSAKTLTTNGKRQVNIGLMLLIGGAALFTLTLALGDHDVFKAYSDAEIERAYMSGTRLEPNFTVTVRLLSISSIIWKIGVLFVTYGVIAAIFTRHGQIETDPATVEAEEEI